ncbi:MAG: hypothetical protein ACP5D6_09050 [Kosmotogaceae bacterium]
MTRKKSEKRLRDLINHYNWWGHKYGDVRYCIHCHKPLPKSERAPDYYLSQIGDWIECKNNDSTGTWRCAEIMPGGERQLQRDFLNENGGWLFIELADGRAPKKAAAYLVIWDFWVNHVEPILIKEDMSSFRRETTYNKDGSVRRLGGDRLLSDWELEWKEHIGWIIPRGHFYWKELKAKLSEMIEDINEMQRGETPCQERLI